MSVVNADNNSMYWDHYPEPSVCTELQRNVKINTEDLGKWMIFRPKEDIENIWEKAKKCYKSNSLNGVTHMKCSTRKDNERASSENTGVIILYCPDSHNENHIKRIGTKILEIFPCTDNEYIYYKTDEQTLAGTRATGQDKNYLYKLKNPHYKPVLSEKQCMDCWKHIEDWKTRCTNCYRQYKLQNPSVMVKKKCIVCDFEIEVEEWKTHCVVCYPLSTKKQENIKNVLSIMSKEPRGTVFTPPTIMPQFKDDKKALSKTLRLLKTNNRLCEGNSIKEYKLLNMID